MVYYLCCNSYHYTMHLFKFIFTRKSITSDSFKVIRRLSSSSKKVPRVCVVGAGPAGFYAATHLSKKLDSVIIDIIEKLPVPFGLVRYGVAPDHPEVKNVINQFTKLAQQKNVNFYGNITLGKDLTLNQLRQHYDAVLLTYGAEEDKVLGIENEDAKNVIAARNFVGWYNGHPRDTNLKVDLSGQTAAILGQGNVALDVARILLSPVDELKKTDITEYALQEIAESKIKELYLVGRRGPLNVAFTIKELREQINLKSNVVVWRKDDFVGVADVVSNLARPRKRLTELMLKTLNDSLNDQLADKAQKFFKPIFFRSPRKFLVDDQKNLIGIELVCNQLIGDKIEEQKCLPTNDSEILNCSLAFRSIGYRSIKVDSDLNFSNGLVINERGRVLDSGNGDSAKLYVAGWLGTGPVGVILHTMSNAFQVAKFICEDLQKHNEGLSKGGFEELKKNMLKNNKPIIDWQGWIKIDHFEIEQGKKKVGNILIMPTSKHYVSIMAEENWNDDGADPVSMVVDSMPLPQADIPEIKLFGRWSCYDVQVSDMSLQDYISVKEKYAKYLPHSAGRYAHKRFRKAQCPIVERLTNSLMMHGRNNGKKLMAVRIVKHAFEIIHLLTGENPLQVLVTAIINSGPREDSTRIGRAGTVRRQAVDVSPLRRVNQAIWLLCTGAREAAFRNIKTIAECVADELINAAKGSSNSYAIKKKDELERVAKSNR
ncbi:NADPH:adrenodoxin oxidoreductase, mitochondrial isoform X2 [Bicyclus anynana]|uniref:NADPH:adrenodoxin oxidoreductase, mitochondrial isoform X2 n=101 Tax=Satyrinae TaxID=42282 RepID=A0A6J1NEZ4_BICAN|nr:NADPH:adrenodoxin oxidoreductase, mitochondrial isoform X2 [Bicyclus anynana]